MSNRLLATISWGMSSIFPQLLAIWSIWFVLFFWFIWFVSFNQINQTDQSNQMNQRGREPQLRVSRSRGSHGVDEQPTKGLATRRRFWLGIPPYHVELGCQA